MTRPHLPYVAGFGGPFLDEPRALEAVLSYCVSRPRPGSCQIGNLDAVCACRKQKPASIRGANGALILPKQISIECHLEFAFTAITRVRFRIERRERESNISQDSSSETLCALRRCSY